MNVLVAQSCQSLCNPMDCSPQTTSMQFSRQEYWSGEPFPPPGDLLDPGIEPRSPTLQVDSSPAEPPGKPRLGRGCDSSDYTPPHYVFRSSESSQQWPLHCHPTKWSHEAFLKMNLSSLTPMFPFPLEFPLQILQKREIKGKCNWDGKGATFSFPEDLHVICFNLSWDI